MTERRKYWIGAVAMVWLGIILVVAGYGKLNADASTFDITAFPGFIPDRMSAVIFILLPYIELLIGILLISGIGVKFAASVSFLLIIGFAVSNILLAISGAKACPSCFGQYGSLTLLQAGILDTVMMICVLVIFYCRRGKYFNTTPWVLEKEGKVV